MSEQDRRDFTSLTVTLLSAFVTNNKVESGALIDLIATTHAALRKTTAPVDTVSTQAAVEPAVSVRKSLSSRDHLLSLIDGKPYKTLRRHLASRGLTPAEYRQRFGLPATYPMVAPAYAEQRRSIAAQNGLGQRVRPAGKARQAVAAAAAPEPMPKLAKEAKPPQSKPSKPRRKASAALSAPTPPAMPDPISEAPKRRRLSAKFTAEATQPSES
jgi:predicted transcriptional regulator